MKAPAADAGTFVFFTAAVLLILPAAIMLSAERSTAPVHFTDITDSAGITFRHTSSPEKKYIVESMSGGVALFDYNNDGWLDIYFTDALTVDTADNPRASRSALYRNNGDGSFTDVTEKSGLAHPGWAMGVAAADYDGDGYQDLYVTCFGHNRLYRNNGDGSFSDVTSRSGVDDQRWSTGAAFGDYDRNGTLDLFVSNYIDLNLSALPPFGKAQSCNYRGVPVQCGPRGLRGAGDSLFRNNGDGTFTNVAAKAGVSDPQERFGLTSVWTDIDGDGWPDLFVANDATGNYLYHNNRDGTFTEIGLGAGVSLDDDGVALGSMGVSIGDYLHTGLPGIFITNFSGEHASLYRHDSVLAFTDVSYPSRVAPVTIPLVGWGTCFLDYDNDGWADLIAVNGHVYPQMEHAHVDTTYRQRMLLFHNEGNGNFTEVASTSSSLITPRVSRGVACGDIDNDGDIDIVVNNLDGKPTILRNDGGNNGNWITIKLITPGRNRDAIGARVKVVSHDITQWDEIRTSGSYLSSSDLRLHYGLGQRDEVDLIEIHWPDGKIEAIRQMPANRFLTIEEGKGILRASPPGRQR